MTSAPSDAARAAHGRFFRSESEQLRALATRVINEHVDDRGWCAVRGCAFPCERAVLAEHNLDLL